MTSDCLIRALWQTVGSMTAAVALMFFTLIASYAQDISPAPPGTVAPSAVDTHPK
jgi:hypothetical protein